MTEPQFCIRLSIESRALTRIRSHLHVIGDLVALQNFVAQLVGNEEGRRQLRPRMHIVYAGRWSRVHVTYVRISIRLGLCISCSGIAPGRVTYS